MPYHHIGNFYLLHFILYPLFLRFFLLFFLVYFLVFTENILQYFLLIQPSFATYWVPCAVVGIDGRVRTQLHSIIFWQAPWLKGSKLLPYAWSETTLAHEPYWVVRPQEAVGFFFHYPIPSSLCNSVFFSGNGACLPTSHHGHMIWPRNRHITNLSFCIQTFYAQSEISEQKRYNPTALCSHDLLSPEYRDLLHLNLDPFSRGKYIPTLCKAIYQTQWEITWRKPTCIWWNNTNIKKESELEDRDKERESEREKLKERNWKRESSTSFASSVPPNILPLESPPQFFQGLNSLLYLDNWVLILSLQPES